MTYRDLVATEFWKQLYGQTEKKLRGPLTSEEYRQMEVQFGPGVANETADFYGLEVQRETA